jgi:hypothetical protein
MGPRPVSVLAMPRRSKGGEPQESRRSREGPADPSDPEDLETQAECDVTPLNACGGRPRESNAEARTEGENALEGRIPRRHVRVGSRKGSGDARLRVGNEALKSTASARSQGARRIDAGNDTKAWGPRGPPIDAWTEALKGEAHGRSEDLRVSGGREVDAVTRVPKPDAARRGAGSPAKRGSSLPHVS